MDAPFWVWLVAIPLGLMLGAAFALPLTSKKKPGHPLRTAFFTFGGAIGTLLFGAVFYTTFVVGGNTDLGMRVLAMSVFLGAIWGLYGGLSRRRRGLVY